MKIFPRCAACVQPFLLNEIKRFAGQRVCPECWQALTRLEQSRSCQGLPRASILALFNAEVAVRQAG
jgi:hypothetical protein